MDGSRNKLLNYLQQAVQKPVPLFQVLVIHL
jgi:hypothetical protein